MQVDQFRYAQLRLETIVNKRRYFAYPMGLWALRALFLLLFLSLSVLALAAPSAFAAKQILMQASVDTIQTDQGVTATLIGRIFETSNISIPNAVISIQVNDPQGTSVHVAVAYSDTKGSFQDTFYIALTSPGGNYTAFLVAGKPGYDTARTVLIFSYSSPDFSIQASTPALSLRQGESGSVTITVLALRGFHGEVNLTTLELPSGVTLRFNPTSLAPSKSVTARLDVSNFASIGNYTITFLGVSGSASHKVSLQLNIFPGPIQAVYLLITVVAVVVVALVFILRRRGERRKKEAAIVGLIRQTSTDKGYVATARAIARLEELRATNEVDEDTYQKLRKEYEKRLEKSK
jgi:hypothetical protein